MDIDKLISWMLISLGGIISLGSFRYSLVSLNVDISILFILTGMNIFMMGWIVALLSKVKELEQK